jgi:hypothetical protein
LIGKRDGNINLLRVKIADMAGKGEERRNKWKIRDRTFIELVEYFKHLKTIIIIVSVYSRLQLYTCLFVCLSLWNEFLNRDKMYRTY